MSTTPTLRDAAQALKPCPFCGAEAFGHSIEPHQHSDFLKALAPGIPDHPGSYVIEGACQCGSGLIGDTEAEVTARWNRRAALTQGAGAVEPFAYAVECYPHRADIFKGETAYEFREQGDPKDAIYSAQQLQQAVARALEELKFHPQASHVEPNYRDWFNKTIDAALFSRAKGTHQ